MKKYLLAFGLALACGAQDDSFDDGGAFAGTAGASDEIGSVKQGILAQTTTGSDRFITGVIADANGQKGKGCYYSNMPAAFDCILPPSNRVLRISAVSLLQASRNSFLSTLNSASALGGSGWAISACDGCGAFEMALETNNSAGDSAVAAFDTRRYLSLVTTYGAALTESPATGGTWHVATGYTVRINANRLFADCSSANPCYSQGLLHLVAQGMLRGVGVGVDLPSVSATRDFYSSYDMAPVAAKGALSAGEKCRTRLYFDNSQPTVFTPGFNGCSND